MTVLLTENSLDELATALSAFQGEVPVIPKGRTAKIQTERGRDYSYTYADLASIAPVVMPLLAKHGLAFTAVPTSGDADHGPMLVGMLLHTSGQRISGEWPITGRSPQEIGSSLTYGRRYLLGCLTGVVTDDDDDGQLAERATRTRARKAGPPEADPPPPVAPVTPIQRRKRPVPAEPEPEETPEPEPPPDVMGDGQRRALFGAMGKAFPEAQRDERLALCAAIVGHPVASSDELTRLEGSAIIRWLEDFTVGREAYSYDPDTGLAYVWPTDPDGAP